MTLARKPTHRPDWLLHLLFTSLLAGCGSGSEIPDFNNLFALEPAATPPPAPPATVAPPPAGEPPPEQGRIVVVSKVTEYEPNDQFENANPVSFEAADADENISIEITGSVERDSDDADFFVLTPTRTDNYGVYLCAASCTEHPVTDEVYIAVYDQSQTTIASTPVGTAAEQLFAVELEAGLAYYVEVNGYNTVFEYDYQLVIVD